MWNILIPAAIGAGVGALSGGDPLKGAAKGAAMGAGVGALGGAGGLLAASSAAPAAAATPASSIGAMQSLPSAASMGFGAPQSGGLLSTVQGFGQQASQYADAAKPFLNAANVGLQTASLLSPKQEPLAAAPMPQQSMGGAQTLGQIAQGQTDPLAAQRAQMMAQHRAMWG